MPNQASLFTEINDARWHQTRPLQFWLLVQVIISWALESWTLTPHCVWMCRSELLSQASVTCLKHIWALISIWDATFKFNIKKYCQNNYTGHSMNIWEALEKHTPTYFCVVLCCGVCVCVWVDRAKLLVVVCWGQGSSVSTPSLSRAHGSLPFPSALGTNKPGSAVLLSTLRLINQSQGRLDFKQKQTLPPQTLTSESTPFSRSNLHDGKTIHITTFH